METKRRVRKKGKKARQFGKSTPSEKRYKNEERWIKNKARRIAKYGSGKPNRQVPKPVVMIGGRIAVKGHLEIWGPICDG